MVQLKSGAIEVLANNQTSFNSCMVQLKFAVGDRGLSIGCPF